MPDAKEMIRAAKNGDVARISALLEEDPALLHTLDADGSTPLHYAVWKGHVETVRLLLERGADVHVQNNNSHWGGTPLHAAAHGNQKAAAELLIAHGADVNFCSNNGRTPLQETTLHKATSVAKLLRQQGATE